jgi:hypothetical protein
MPLFLAFFVQLGKNTISDLSGAIHGDTVFHARQFIRSCTVLNGVTEYLSIFLKLSAQFW